MMLRDDCALNLWRIQIAPNPQACESIADLSLSEVPSACRAAFQVRTTISGVVTSWRIWSATARADLGSSRTA
jgi:hypothetical protein